MGRLFFIALLTTLSIVSLGRPWIGVVASYGLVLLTPQAVWYWNFDGLRPALWLLAPTLLGFGLAAVQGRYTMSTVVNRRNLYLLTLWFFFTLSYYFGAYVHAGGPYRFTDPDWAMETLNKILLLYLVASFCLDTEKKLRVLTWVLVGSAIYLIYWANDRYLSGYVIGRMGGPVDVYGIGTYADENMFALFFVIAQPFLWYFGLSSNQPVVRWTLWLAIPFGWHAVFLTASRGGLVGLVVVTLLMTMRSKRRLLGLALIPAFLIAYQWQAGDLMKSRAETIDEYRADESASARLEAWEAALAMAREHPVVGVGLASFGPAFPEFSEAIPREAHSTIFQIGAESGLVAALMYVLVTVGSILALWRNGVRMLKDDPQAARSFLYLINEATLIASVGLAICSLFLSLQMFEIIYFLFLMTNVILFVSATRRGASLVDAAAVDGGSASDAAARGGRRFGAQTLGVPRTGALGKRVDSR